MTINELQQAFRDKTRVEIVGDDSYFSGIVVTYFTKRKGAIRCAVENDDGILHIFNPKQLKPWRA